MNVKAEQLKQQAMKKLQEAERALHEWACEEDVGDNRTIAFNMYEIVRTAPREARTGL